MNKWNLTAKVKAIVICLFTIPNFFYPFDNNQAFDAVTLILVFSFAALIYPITFKYNLSWLFGSDLASPSWNDNPLIFKRPLAFIQFLKVFFIAAGLSILMGAAIQFGHLPMIGFMAIAFGAGMHVGIFLTLRWVKKEIKN
jgi:hypothetical protein